MLIQEMKGWIVLFASFLLLLLICALAMMGVLTRPVRWSERS